MYEEEMIAKHHLEVKIITKKGAPNILLKDCNSIMKEWRMNEGWMKDKWRMNEAIFQHIKKNFFEKAPLI